MSVATPPPPVAETPPMNSQPSPRNTAVQNRALWRVARREMRSNIGRTSLVAGFTLFGMLSAAATVALFGWGVQPDPNTLDVPWWSPFVALITSIPPMLVALLPTMLIIGAAFSVSTKRRSTHYQRLRSIGARNDQILRLVIFEALVPAAMSAAVAGVILTVALIILGATPLWIIIALTVMIAVTLFAIGAAAWFPARSILTTSLEPGPATPAAAHSTPYEPSADPWPKRGAAALIAGLMLLIVAAQEFSFWLPMVASLLIFGGALTLLSPLMHRLGKVTPHLGGNQRFAIRDLTRNRSRSVSLLAAAIGLSILAVMASAGLISDQDEYGRAMDNRFIVGPGSGPEADSFIATTHATVLVDHNVALQSLSHADTALVGWTDSTDGEIGQSLGSAALYTDELAAALDLPATVRAAADAGDIVVLSTGRMDSVSFGKEDVGFVRHPIGLMGNNASRRAALPALTPVLIPPATAEEWNLQRAFEKDRSFIVAQTAPTDTQKAIIADHAGSAVDSDSQWQFSRNQVDFASTALSARAIVKIAALIAGLLGTLLGLFTAGLASAENNDEISMMVATGAKPSIRRRVLATQSWTYLTLGGLIGSVLGTVLFWAITRGDSSVPDPIFAWLTMATMTFVVPAVTALLVLMLFRSAKPTVSRRATV